MVLYYLLSIYWVLYFGYKRCGGEIDILGFCFDGIYILVGKIDNKWVEKLVG